MSSVEWEAFEVLVTDSDEVAPTDIAESGGSYFGPVYRALDRIDQMTQREYGSVELRSSYVSELVHDAVPAQRSELVML